MTVRPAFRPLSAPAFLAWWALWRLPFWRALPDFFDSPEFEWRVHDGFWSGLHNPGGHLPYQGTLYGPAGLLYTLLGGALSEEACTALFSTLYGAAGALALWALWRRLCAPEVGAAALWIYPLLSGPALADVSTYSASAVTAFVWGGSALLASGLARACHDRRGGRLRLAGAALLLGLGAYTHLIALLWAPVPLAIWLGGLGGARGLACAQCSVAARRRAAAEGAALAGLGVLVLVGIACAEVAVSRGLPGPLAGAQALLLRDWAYAKPPLDASRLKVIRQHFLQVTGGLGIWLFAAGLLRWAWREGAWARLAAAAVLVSVAVTGRQYVWGFNGRIYLPVLALAVPLMIEGAGLLGRAAPAMLGLLYLQSAVTTLAVLGTRRLGPHPNANELLATRVLEARGDYYVTDPQHRTFNGCGSKTLTWGGLGDGPALEAMLDEARGTGHRLWTSTQAERYAYRLRDGHLYSLNDWRVANGLPTSLEIWAARSAAVVLDAPLGRGEALLELAGPEDAPGLAERLARARGHLEGGQALLLLAGAPDGADAAVFELLPAGALGCVNRERYDAWELASYFSVLSGFCEDVTFGLTDATGLALRPAPALGRYRLKVSGWRDPDRRASWPAAGAGELVLGPADFVELPWAEAAARLERAPRPLAAALEPAGPGRVRLAIRALGPG